MNKQDQFNKANEYLKEGKLNEFIHSLKNLFTNLTCNCFLRSQPEAIYKDQLNIIQEYQDNDSDFALNLAKGFIYLRNKQEHKAYIYLSNAISIDCLVDLPYSLRSSINVEINSSFKEDAEKAILLNPSARNYFFLANIIDNINDKNTLEKSIEYYDVAISLQPEFSCAYNNKASVYKKLNNNEAAIREYTKCLEIEPEHWAYYQLWVCLDEEKRHPEALKWALLGHSKHPDNANYQFCLGLANARLEKYEDAIYHYQNYLSEYPDSSVTKRNLEISQRKLANKYLIEAKDKFNKGEYNVAVLLFDKYLSNDHGLSGKDLDIYLRSLLKNHNRDIIFGEDNFIYKRLDDLKSSFFQKKGTTENILEEEENINKLMIYQARYKIGFGIHDGKHLIDIIEEDPNYILWCIIYLIHFSIDKALFLNQKLKNDPDYFIALEHNLIKEFIIEKWAPEEDDDDYYEKDFSNYSDYHDYDRDTFDALTDGQLGDWDDFGGDIDDVMTWLGR